MQSKKPSFFLSSYFTAVRSAFPHIYKILKFTLERTAIIAPWAGIGSKLEISTVYHFWIASAYVPELHSSIFIDKDIYPAFGEFYWNFTNKIADNSV